MTRFGIGHLSLTPAGPQRPRQANLMKFTVLTLGALAATGLLVSKAYSTVDYDTLRLRELIDELAERYPNYLDSSDKLSRDHAEDESLETRHFHLGTLFESHFTFYANVVCGDNTTRATFDVRAKADNTVWSILVAGNKKMDSCELPRPFLATVTANGTSCGTKVHVGKCGSTGIHAGSTVIVNVTKSSFTASPDAETIQ